MKHKLAKTTFSILLIAALLAASLSFIPQLSDDTAYADTTEEIYYSDDVGYCEEYSASTETETIAYATKQTTSAKINPTFPAYYNTNTSITNTCANSAGSNIIGFYDRYYTNLIENCNPGVAYPSIYYYYPMTSNQALRQAVINELYVTMSTNTTHVGSTQAQYKAGLTTYANAKGRGISFTSVRTNGALDMTKVAAAINNGTPISLFLIGYNYAGYSDSGSAVTLNKNIFLATISQ